MGNVLSVMASYEAYVENEKKRKYGYFLKEECEEILSKTGEKENKNTE